MSGQRRVRGVLLALAIVSLAMFLGHVLVGLGEAPQPTRGSDGYSLSGLGHAALLDLLAQRKVPLTRSRWASTERVREQDTLVLVEPEPRLGPRGGRPALDGMLEHAGRTLLVLPKRLPGPPLAHEPRWMDGSSLRPLEQVDAVLAPLGLTARRVTRMPGPSAWERSMDLPSPVPAGPLQLLEPSLRLEPWIACDEGVLLGRLRMAGHEVVVLADPDPLAHHALGRDGNAAFALALLEQLRGRGTLVWDETWQGHVAPQRVTPLLLQGAMGLVTVSLLLVALLALGAGMSRLRPAPAPAPSPGTPSPGPARAAGREALVSSAARLLERGDPREAVLRAYAQGIERECLERQAGSRVGPAAARAALDARAAQRGLPPSASLAAGVESVLARGRPTVSSMLGEAQRIHHWKEEVHHGRRRDP